MIRFRTTGQLLGAILLFPCLYCSPRKDVNTNPSESSRINTYLQEYVDRMHLPGMTIAVTRNDSVIYQKAFGVTNVDTGKLMKVTNDFHWASVSKTFVATAVMQMVEQGKIKMDEKLITYLPYFKQKDDWYKDITIRQMLNHTSGLGDVDDYEWDKPQFDEGAAEKWVRTLSNDKMRFKPGTDWAYSNTAYEILGVVISKISGVSFETYEMEHILKPLQMNTSSFIYPDIPDSLRVSGHIWAGKAVVSKVYPYNRIHAPSSTMNSNVLDMSNYAMAHLHRGEYNGARILNDSTYNLLWTNSVNITDKPKVGVSWFLGERHGTKTVEHSGGDTGFRSDLLLLPDKNISVMTVSNYELFRSRDVTLGVADILLGHDPEPIKSQIGFAMGEVLAQNGMEAAKKFYTDTKADSVRSKLYLWAEDDGALAYPGYLFMNNEMIKEAIEMFKFNVETFPNSGYAYGHLARAYAKGGDNAAASENFEKAIKLLPDDKDLVEELKLVQKNRK